MTGRYDDSAQRPNVAWQPPAAEGGVADTAAPKPADAEAAEDQPGLYEDPSTDGRPHPAPSPAPQNPAAPNPAVHNPATQSGPPPAPGPSGPYQVPGGSGPYPVQGGSGAYQVPGGSGPYPVQGGSGPYQVAGGSGPYQVPPQQQPGGFPYPQQQPYQQPQVYAQPQYQQQPSQGAQPVVTHELSSARLIKQEKRRPQSGWRKALYSASGGLVNVGESTDDAQRRELIIRVNQPLRGCYKIAMLSLKGGVGKTTVTTTLGSTFASLRGDRVIAVDANPDRGTLSQKIPLETTATVRHLLRDASRITRYSDVRAYTSQGPSRLEVLASEQDPAVSEAFSEDDYRRT